MYMNMSKIHFKVHYPLQFTIFSKVTGSIPGKGTIGMCWPLWLHKKIVPASVRFELKTSWLLVLSINQLSYLADHKYVYINVRYHLFIHHNLLFFQRSQVRSQVKALLGCVRNWMGDRCDANCAKKKFRHQGDSNSRSLGY